MTDVERTEQRQQRQARIEHMRRLEQQLRDEHTVDGLIRLLNSRDVDTVRAASLVLGDHGDPVAVPALLSVLQTADDHWLKDGAALALRDIGDWRARDALLQEIRDPANAGYTGTLIYALKPFDVRDAVGDLVRFVCHGEYESAWMAVTVIREFPSPLEAEQRQTALLLLANCLADTTPEETEDWRLAMLDGLMHYITHHDG